MKFTSFLKHLSRKKKKPSLSPLANAIDKVLNLQDSGAVAFSLQYRQIFINAVLWDSFQDTPVVMAKLMHVLLATLNYHLSVNGLPAQKEEDVTLCFITSQLPPELTPGIIVNRKVRKELLPVPDLGNMSDRTICYQFAYANKQITMFELFNPLLPEILLNAAEAEEEADPDEEHLNSLIEKSSNSKN